MTRVFISWQGGGPLDFGGSQLSAIGEHDPSFSLDAFTSFAEAVFLRVNRARASGQLDEVRRLLADALWQEFQLEGAAPGRAQLAMAGAQAVGGGHDQSWDTVVVRFTASQAGRRNRTLVEDWTFQRPAQDTAVAPAAGAAAEATDPAATQPSTEQGECPVCGAPLSLTDEGTCRYCGASAKGGLGGWRLVRTAPVQDPQPVVSSGGKSLVGVIGVIVVLALVAVPIVITLIVAGAVSGAIHQAVNVVPGAASGQLSGHGSFSGAVTGDTDGTLAYFGGVTGPCTSRARQLTGISFTDIEHSDGGRKLLAARVNLPPGREGAGTYNVVGSGYQLNANYVFTPETAGKEPESQTWQVDPAKTKALLVVRPDGSGSLTVSGMAPVFPKAAGDSLGTPLDFTISFSCS